MEKTTGDEKRFGIWAVRSSSSICGAAQAWVKRDGKPEMFDTYRECYSMYVHYYSKEMDLTNEMDMQIG